MSAIFSNFLHFTRSFFKTLKISSARKFSPISYSAYVKGVFLDLFSYKTKFSQFQSKIRENYFLQVVFTTALRKKNLCKDFDISARIFPHFAHVKILTLDSVITVMMQSFGYTGIFFLQLQEKRFFT